MFRQLLRPAASIMRAEKRGFYAVQKIDPPSLDCLPVPQGSWQEHYNKEQRKYNMQLVASVAAFVISVVIGKSTGLLYFNYAPPTPKEK